MEGRFIIGSEVREAVKEVMVGGETKQWSKERKTQRRTKLMSCLPRKQSLGWEGPQDICGEGESPQTGAQGQSYT